MVRSVAPKSSSSVRGSRASASKPATQEPEDHIVIGCGLRLRKTADPDVYVNPYGALVGADGVVLSLSRAKRMREREVDEARQLAVMDEVAKSEEELAAAASPAQLLRAIALDPRVHMETRIDCAKAAAPYFDRRMPLALEGGDPNRPIKQDSSVTLRQLDVLDPSERKTLLQMLEKIGALPPIGK